MLIKKECSNSLLGYIIFVCDGFVAILIQYMFYYFRSGILQVLHPNWTESISFNWKVEELFDTYFGSIQSDIQNHVKQLRWKVFHGFQPLTIFEKLSNLDVSEGPLRSKIVLLWWTRALNFYDFVFIRFILLLF